jgi:hypothetical protein
VDRESIFGGRVGSRRVAASHDADVSSIQPIIPYSGFSPIRLEGWPFGWCLPRCQRALKSAPDIRAVSAGLHPPFVHLVVPHSVGMRTRSCTTMKWDHHYPRGPRSCSSYAVSSRHHLIDPMRPTSGHIAISPHGGFIRDALAVRGSWNTKPSPLEENTKGMSSVAA